MIYLAFEVFKALAINRTGMFANPTIRISKRISEFKLVLKLKVNRDCNPNTNLCFTLFECTAFEEEREVFLSRLYSVCPLARQSNDEYRCRLVMGDKLPREIENPLYRYLIAISKLRLGILTEQGEGS